MNNRTLVIEVTRGPAVESVHRVHAVVMEADESVVAAYGDTGRLVFPRSSLKPLQALALVESGAAEAFHVSDIELALACASHSGEKKHMDAVAAWLQRLGLDENTLLCGPRTPIADPCAPATVLANDCSGKHTGMLTLAKFIQAPLADYTNPEHRLQRTILSAISDLCGLRLGAASCGIDGCSAPIPALPLESLARGFAQFLAPEKFSLPRAAALRRILKVMTEYPDYVGGTGRLDTVLMEAARGKIMSKGGAEGVFICVIPRRGAAIALKAEDGGQRASQAALHALLEHHELADASVLDAIRPLALPVLKNARGTDVGQVQYRIY